MTVETDLLVLINAMQYAHILLSHIQTTPSLDFLTPQFELLNLFYI